MEITIKNANRSRKFGFGWSTTPSGRDSLSIQSPGKPEYTGTIKSIQKELAADKSYQAYGSRSASNYSAREWFYDGKPITAIWRYGVLKPAPDIPVDYDNYEGWERRNSDHHYNNDVLGNGFFVFRAEYDLDLLTGETTIKVKEEE